MKRGLDGLPWEARREAWLCHVRRQTDAAHAQLTHAMAALGLSFDEITAHLRDRRLTRRPEQRRRRAA